MSVTGIDYAWKVLESSVPDSCRYANSIKTHPKPFLSGLSLDHRGTSGVWLLVVIITGNLAWIQVAKQGDGEGVFWSQDLCSNQT